MIATITTPPITQSTIKPGLARKDHEINIMVLYGHAQFIMVIELRGVKLGMKSYPLFHHKYDFRPKLDNMNLITAPFT